MKHAEYAALTHAQRRGVRPPKPFAKPIFVDGFLISWNPPRDSSPLGADWGFDRALITLVDQENRQWQFYSHILRANGCLQPAWGVMPDTITLRDRCHAAHGKTGIMPVLTKAVRRLVFETIDRYPDEKFFAMFGDGGKRTALYQSWTDLRPDLDAIEHPLGIIWKRR